MYNGGQCRRGFPPETTPFIAALVLSALPGLSVLHSALVSVLMFIMPPVKIYIKSYDAARSHASNQSSLIMRQIHSSYASITARVNIAA